MLYYACVYLPVLYSNVDKIGYENFYSERSWTMGYSLKKPIITRGPVRIIYVIIERGLVRQQNLSYITTWDPWFRIRQTLKLRSEMLTLLSWPTSSLGTTFQDKNSLGFIFVLFLTYYSDECQTNAWAVNTFRYVSPFSLFPKFIFIYDRYIYLLRLKLSYCLIVIIPFLYYHSSNGEWWIEHYCLFFILILLLFISGSSSLLA